MTRLFSLLILCMVLLGVSAPIALCAEDCTQAVDVSHMRSSIKSQSQDLNQSGFETGAHFCSLGHCPILHSILKLDLTAHLLGSRPSNPTLLVLDTYIEPRKRPPQG